MRRATGARWLLLLLPPLARLPIDEGEESSGLPNTYGLLPVRSSGGADTPPSRSAASAMH